MTPALSCRSTPCPSVKHGDEWGEPSRCDSGDGCQYCHSRTEQQFHPEVQVGAGLQLAGQHCSQPRRGWVWVTLLLAMFRGP